MVGALGPPPLEPRPKSGPGTRYVGQVQNAFEDSKVKKVSEDYGDGIWREIGCEQF